MPELPGKSSKLSDTRTDHPVLDLASATRKEEPEETEQITTTPLSMSSTSASPRQTTGMGHNRSPSITQGGPIIDTTSPTGSAASFSSSHGPPGVAESNPNASTNNPYAPTTGSSGGGTGEGVQRGYTVGGGSLRRPGGLADSPNARSKTITMADGQDTFGALNRHPNPSPLSNSSNSPSSSLQQSSNNNTSSSSPNSVSNVPTFRVGVSEDRNRKCRRTMEDSHSFVYDFAGVRGQGYFAVFDGHAGKHAAEWCGQNFHEWFLDCLIESPTAPIPDLLNETFHKVDSRLSRLATQDNTHSGCTAVTAFLRIEERGGSGKGFLNPKLESRGLMHGRGEEELERLTSLKSSHSGDETPGGGGAGKVMRRKSSGKRLKDFVGRLTGRDKDTSNNDNNSNNNNNNNGNGLSSADASSSEALDTSDDPLEDLKNRMPIADGNNQVELIDAKSENGLRRVLYTANVGDARAVLCRGGKAVRLTYDHKGSDEQEAKRITDAGGFVMNNRVNGVLAVTRSLGDSSMKEFVVGSPYTTETTLDEDDEFLIVACDGLWDVTEDQDAVDLIRKAEDPQEASKILLDYAIQNYSTDNLSVMVIRFKTA